MAPDARADETRLRELLFSSYSELWQCAAALTGEPDGADGVVAAAVRRLCRRPHTLRNARAARVYLFRTVIAGAASGRGLAHEDHGDEPVDLDLALDLRQQLADVPARRRACLVLHGVLGLTELETAERLGCRSSTVRRALRREPGPRLASLRTPAPTAEVTARARARLVHDLPQVRRTQTRLTVPLGAAVLLVLGSGIGVAVHRSDRPADAAAAAAVPAPAPRFLAGALADGLNTVSSLVDVAGNLWLAGSYPGGNTALVHVEIATRQSSSSVLLDPADGLVDGVGHLAATSGQVFAILGDSGLQTFRGDGTQVVTLSGGRLGTEPERLAASDATGLWVLSCCGAAPQAQQLAQQRDIATLKAVAEAQDITPFPGSLLAAGPAGVWLVDGATGALRRVDTPDHPAGVTHFEPHPARLPHDLLAVDTDGPVLATADQLISADADGVTLAATLPAGERDPRALAVTGTTAYLAFADRVTRYDLASDSFSQTGSYAVPGVTAMTVGADGVWAATSGRLIRIDTLSPAGASPRR